MVIKVTDSGMALLPTTGVIMNAPAKIYSVILVQLTFIFSGLILHRDHTSRIDVLTEATPARQNLRLMGKFAAILILQLVLLILILITGIIFQWSEGFYNVQLELYLYHIIIIIWLPLIIWALLAFFIHALFKNVYIGIFLLFIIWVGVQGLPELGLNSHLIRFNSPPTLEYSEITGYNNIPAFLLVQAYWLMAGTLLLIAGISIFPRSAVSGFRDRYIQMESEIKRRRSWISISLILIIFTWLATLIYREEQKLNRETSRLSEGAYNAFSNEYDYLSSLDQPGICYLDAVVELYMDNLSMEIRGYMLIANNLNDPIDTLIIKTGFDEQTHLDLDVEWSVLAEDEELGFYLVGLGESMQPGDTIQLSFNIRNRPNSIFYRSANIQSGYTMLGQDVFPAIGYAFNANLPELSGQEVSNLHYQSQSTHRLNTNITIGTPMNQLGIAPGKLIKRWQNEGRNYFTYRSELPIKYSFGIHSGTFSSDTLDIGNVSLIRHTHHSGKVNEISKGVEDALSLGDKYFEPYRFDEIRIVEFPQTNGTFATASANNLLISEYRFISEAKEDSAQTDLLYYVVAHELLHHWWGQNMAPGYGKGATMLSESITEYLMLILLERNKGQEAANQWRILQQERYRKGRVAANIDEVPLILVDPEQQYLSYGKGAISFYQIGEAVGHDHLLAILSLFYNKYVDGPPYPSSLDFVEFLKNETDMKYHDLINSNLMTTGVE